LEEEMNKYSIEKEVKRVLGTKFKSLSKEDKVILKKYDKYDQSKGPVVKQIVQEECWYK